MDAVLELQKPLCKLAEFAGWTNQTHTLQGHTTVGQELTPQTPLQPEPP
jgi:hypothetical protein